MVGAAGPWPPVVGHVVGSGRRRGCSGSGFESLAPSVRGGGPSGSRGDTGAPIRWRIRSRSRLALWTRFGPESLASLMQTTRGRIPTRSPRLGLGPGTPGGRPAVRVPGLEDPPAGLQRPRAPTVSSVGLRGPTQRSKDSCGPCGPPEALWGPSWPKGRALGAQSPPQSSVDPRAPPEHGPSLQRLAFGPQGASGASRVPSSHEVDLGGPATSQGPLEAQEMPPLHSSLSSFKKPALWKTTPREGSPDLVRGVRGTPQH